MAFSKPQSKNFTTMGKNSYKKRAAGQMRTASLSDFFFGFILHSVNQISVRS